MGQAKRKGRVCPVVGGVLTPAECGDRRISQIACKEDCPYNPWRACAYDQALQVEDAVYDRLRLRLKQEQHAEPALRSIPQAQEAYTRAYFLTRGRNGLTLFQRWEQACFEGLTNDQIVFLKALASQYAAAIEILEVRGDEETLVRDRLNLQRPPFVIHDRRLADMAGRFTCLLGCLIDMPHYARISGVALVIPLLDRIEAETIIESVVGHLGGPKEGPARNEWLLTHLAACKESFAAIEDAVQESCFKNASYSKTWYQIVTPGYDFVSAMDHCPEVIADTVSDNPNEGMTHEWVWKSASAPVAPDTVPTLGRILYGNGRIRLEAGGIDRAKQLRAAVESLHGHHIRFDRERVDDLGKQMMKRKGERADPARFPPDLASYLPSMEFSMSLVRGATMEEARVKAGDWIDSKSDRWCDEPVPAFGGKTPRQAAADPVLRPRLITMVKHMIARADRAGLDSGRFNDESRIARNLGLSEIDYPVPKQLRDRPREQDQEQDPEVVDRLQFRPLSPFLPAEPLSHDEVFQRARHATSFFEDPGAMLVAFEDDAPDVADWAMNWGGDSLSDYEGDLLFHLISLIWFIVYPPETQAHGVDMKRLSRAGQLMLERLANSEYAPSISELSSPDQPAITTYCNDILLGFMSAKAEKDRISGYAFAVGLILCRSLTDELALSARGM